MHFIVAAIITQLSDFCHLLKNLPQNLYINREKSEWNDPLFITCECILGAAVMYGHILQICFKKTCFWSLIVFHSRREAIFKALTVLYL